MTATTQQIQAGSIVALTGAYRDAGFTFPTGYQFQARAQPFRGKVLVKDPSSGLRLELPAELVEVVKVPKTKQHKRAG